MEKEFEYANKTMTTAKNANHKNQVQNAHSLLAAFNAFAKNYKSAYENHVKYAEIKDSIFTESSSKQIAEMQTKYEDLLTSSEDKWEEVRDTFDSASNSFKQGFSELTTLVK